MEATVTRIIKAFENLSAEGVDDMVILYAPYARFKDPFNDVCGADEILRIFRHMFATLDDPRFFINERIVQGRQCFLTWEFHFAFQRYQRGKRQSILGGSHLVVGASGQIVLHRDYWDAAEELYELLPVIGPVLRLLKAQARA